MTWEELVALFFISYEQPVHVIRGEGLDAVSLQLSPAAWFVSIKSSGRLNIGIYACDELRLVGTRAIPLTELKLSFLRREIEEVLGKQIIAMLDLHAVHDFSNTWITESDFKAARFSRDLARSRGGSAAPRTAISSGCRWRQNF
jgi:hypothetical protein